MFSDVDFFTFSFWTDLDFFLDALITEGFLKEGVFDLGIGLLRGLQEGGLEVRGSGFPAGQGCGGDADEVGDVVKRLSLSGPRGDQRDLIRGRPILEFTHKEHLLSVWRKWIIGHKG